LSYLSEFALILATTWSGRSCIFFEIQKAFYCRLGPK
jgi:hypothetical protein